jgi:putative addiction module component (TIGR02574 family)
MDMPGKPSTDLADLTEAVMALPAPERLDLAVALWQSVHGAGEEQETEEDRQALLAMLQERIRQIDAGEVQCIPAEEAIRRARARLRA